MIGNIWSASGKSCCLLTGVQKEMILEIRMFGKASGTDVAFEWP